MPGAAGKKHVSLYARCQPAFGHSSGGYRTVPCTCTRLLPDELRTGNTSNLVPRRGQSRATSNSSGSNRAAQIVPVKSSRSGGNRSKDPALGGTS
eukprot:4882251-Prymnesium_polylepis.1